MLLIARINPSNQVLLDRVADGVFDEPINPERLAACAADSTHMLLVAVDGDVVVGQLLAAIHTHPDKPRQLYIDDLGVAPDHRRKGIASRLLEKAKGIAQAAGIPEVWLVTNPDNEEAIKLYESVGMKSRPVLVFEY